jgi:adenylate kinase family enzyme
MKYIIIIGASQSGKSTTVNAICKGLGSTKISQLIPNWSSIVDSSFKVVDYSSKLENGTYLIEVNGKLILVVAGSPTEQSIRISILFEICFKLNIRIDFAIVAMRSFEKKEGYDTRNELKKLGELVFETKIYRINQDDFESTIEWKSRIETLIKKIENVI